MSERKIVSVLTATLVGVALMLVASLSTAQQQIVVTSWGSAYQEAQRKAYFEPFTKATGIKVVEATGPDASKIKAMVTSGNVEWDVVDVSLATALVLAEQGLLTPIDYNVFDAQTRAAIPSHFRLPFAVGNETWSVVMAYRRDKFPEGPKSWKDFWDVTKFPGKRAFLDSTFVAPVLEIALLADGVEPKNIYPVDMARAFRSLSRLRPHVVKWTGSSGVMQQMLTDGEADLVVIANGRMEGIQKAGVPAGFTFNQQMILSNFWLIPKGSKNVEAAMKFIAFVSRAEQQAEFARLQPWGPTNPDAFKMIPAARQADLPTAPQNMSTALVSDGQWWARKAADGRTNLENYVRAWNAWWLEGK
jgi:putative spermidine/putrescine transport system substrate-binding protein